MSSGFIDSNALWAAVPVAVISFGRTLMHWYNNRRADKAEAHRDDEEG